MKKNNDKNNKELIIKILPKFFYVIIQSVLCVLLVVLSDKLLYSEYLSSLFILLGICLTLFINIFIATRYLIVNKISLIEKIIFWTILFFSFYFGSFYGVKMINAFRYGNSKEVVTLSRNFSVKEAKKIKRNLEEVFEYDYDGVYSRNISIGNLYEDDDYYVLYINDSSGIYSLKFYVLIENDKFIDIYWKYDEFNLYLVKNGTKTDDFEYYYAMYIVSNLLGEEVSGHMTVEDNIEPLVRKKFDESAAAIFTYEKLNYQDGKNNFYLECYVENMNYYGDMTRQDFTIEFTKNDSKKHRKVWYYGDSSFDYVNWDVNI